MAAEGKTTEIIVTVLYALTMLVSLIGNSVLIFIIWKVREARSLTSFMFVNMAVSYLLVTVSVMPSNINDFYNDFNWPIKGGFGDFTCRTVQYINHISLMASILSLTFMAIDRFYVVHYPLKSRARTHWFRNSKFVSPLIWILSSVLMVIVPIIYFLNKQKSLCELHPLGKSKMSILAFMVFLFLVTYFCPLVIITILYGKTAHTIWFRRTPGERLTETQQSQDEISKKRVIRMLVLIVTVFALCWLPVHIKNLLFAARISGASISDLPQIVDLLTSWLAQASSAINPWLYIGLSTKIRRAFLHLLDSRPRGIEIPLERI